MNAKSPPIRVALVLLAAAATAATLEAQYVPIRALDSNGLMTWSHVPREVVGGIAAGYQSVPGQAVLWDANGSNILAPLTGAVDSAAEGLNSSQVVVGWCTDASYVQTATRWTAGVAEDLNALATGGAPIFMDFAYDIDEHGRIVGAGYDTTTNHGRAFLFDHGTVVDLGSPHGGTDGALAVAVNDHRVAAGECATAGGNRHACRFDSNGALDLHDPTIMGSGPSWSADIARDGKIAGGYGTYFATRSFLWDGTKVVDLTPLIPGRSQLLGMNDFGDVVGWYDKWMTGRTFVVSAFLIHHGVFVDLNTQIDPALGWYLLDATDIDNEGRIVGSGTLGSSMSYAYIMEPLCKGTFTIYGTGCAGSGGLEPRLLGAGRPTPDQDFALDIVDGLPNALALLVLGSGTTTANVTPACSLQNLPLLPPYLLPFVLDPIGESWNQALLPAGTPIFDLDLQALVFDPGAPYGIAATRPLALHFE